MQSNKKESRAYVRLSEYKYMEFYGGMQICVKCL